jgi:hypothetical protein
VGLIHILPEASRVKGSEVESRRFVPSDTMAVMVPLDTLRHRQTEEKKRVCVRLYIYIYTYTHITYNIYIYAHTHTHIYTYTYLRVRKSSV